MHKTTREDDPLRAAWTTMSKGKTPMVARTVIGVYVPQFCCGTLNAIVRIFSESYSTSIRFENGSIKWKDSKCLTQCRPR